MIREGLSEEQQEELDDALDWTGDAPIDLEEKRLQMLAMGGEVTVG